MSKKKPQQLFNKTYFRRLKLSKRPRDIYMFWSGKECKITLMMANHTRFEQLTAQYREVLKGSKIPESQREGTPGIWDKTLKGACLYKIGFAAVTCAPQTWPSLFLAHGDRGLIHVLSFCRKPSKGLWECTKNQAKNCSEYEKWTPSAEGRGKGLRGESVLKSKGT